jgi:ABC-type transport system involved in multi-copper enzyme maturation permease subunit
MLWIVLLIQTGLCAIIPMVMYLVVRSNGSSKEEMSRGIQDLANDRLSFPGTLISTVSTSLSWGLPLLIVLTACAFGGEYAWGTLRLLLSRGEGRREYCHSKLTAMFLIWIVVFGAGIIAALATGSLATALAGGTGLSGIEASEYAEFLGRILAGLLGGATYICFTALLATQTRSTAFSVAGGLVMFFGDRIIGGIAIALEFRPLELLIKAAPGFNVGSLTGDSGSASNPLLLSVIVLLIYCLTFLMGMTRLLSRSDIQVSGVG